MPRGDVTLLDQSEPFLEGAAIAVGAEHAYFTPTVSGSLDEAVIVCEVHHAPVTLRHNVFAMVAFF